jgi:hypothetical protein
MSESRSAERKEAARRTGRWKVGTDGLLGFFAAAAALLAIGIMSVGVLVLAWKSMNFGTLVCFGLVVAWIINEERWTFRLSDSLAVAEKRLRALEEHAGIRLAFEQEWKMASERNVYDGRRPALRLQWPGVQHMAWWRRANWAAWSARYDTYRAERMNASRGTHSWEFDTDGTWNRRGDNLVEQRPYRPPPEGDDYNSAYWSDSARWDRNDSDD